MRSRDDERARTQTERGRESLCRQHRYH